jgi:O-methyltransferase
LPRVVGRLVRRIRWELQGVRLSGVARAVRRRHLTYLSPTKLRTLERCVDLIEAHRVPGDVVEAGVALAGSTVLLATRANGRRFCGYDVFGMIPPPSEKDPPEVHKRYETIREGRSKGLGSDVYYGYRDDLFEHASRVLAEFGAPVGDRVQLDRACSKTRCILRDRSRSPMSTVTGTSRSASASSASPLTRPRAG